MIEKEWKHFTYFANLHVATWDVDPAYPLLKRVFERRHYNDVDGFKHLVKFVAFYRLDSAEHYELGADTKHIVKATERRGFRGNDLAREFIKALSDQMINVFDIGLDSRVGPETKWTKLRKQLEGNVKFCGPWASFKLCDLFKNVLGWDITSPDFGVGGNGKNAGPIPGMVRITGESWETCARDFDLQRRLYERALLEGVPFSGMEMMETSLCDFNSFAKGRYYIGHDIDSQMEQLKTLGPEYWESRAEIFPRHLLGEQGGWFGVRK